MSDYTPTTEEVRSAWMDGLASLGAEFDRWFAEVKAQERQLERERIIAQLEVQKRFVEPELFDGVVEAIALIKGENNE